MVPGELQCYQLWGAAVNMLLWAPGENAISATLLNNETVNVMDTIRLLLASTAVCGAWEHTYPNKTFAHTAS